ncbi:FAD-dependent oxidoreductase [Spirillospora sp. NPDC046719]
MVVVGAGLAGLSAAMRLEREPVVLVERDEAVGGKARSRNRDGYTFDVTGHWLHLRDERLRELVFGLLGGENLVWLERRSTVRLYGRTINYPFQANIHGLPWPARLRCLADFALARLRKRRESPSEMRFEDFVVGRFGRGMARHFFLPYYSKKFRGISLDDLRTEWLKDYFPMPTTAQVLGGALGVRQDRVGYNARFLYPAEGGIGVLPAAMLSACRNRDGFSLRLGTSLQEVDLAGKRLRLSGSPEWFDWRVIVSTIALPELLDRIPGLPPHIAEARGALRSSAMRYANIALRAPSPMVEHWVYTPEPGIPFYRMGVYTNAAAAMAPPGGASLWVEIADQAGPVDDSDILDALVRIGAVRSAADLLFMEHHKVDHAYVVFDEARERAVETILPWLAEAGIHSCGRYGRWTYGSMGDAILDGFSVADLVAESS